METTAADVVLSCRLEIQPDKLKIAYSLMNRGPQEVYALNGFPARGMTARNPVPNPEGVYVCARPNNAALVLLGITPLPADKLVTVRIIPPGTRLAPGERVERIVELPVPLEERSLYYASLPPEQYDIVAVISLTFMVHFIRSTVPGFHAEPAPHGQGLFRVRSQDTVAQASALEQGFRMPSLKLKKRKDMFSRI